MRSRQVFCTVALLVSLVTASVSFAEVFQVTYEVTLNQFSRPPVFGVSQPVKLTTSFTIDTNAAPAVILPSGTGSWPGPTLYGYNRAAISGLSVTFGTQTWGANNLHPRVPRPNRRVMDCSAPLWAVVTRSPR